MANMTARQQSLQDYLHDQLGWFDLEPEMRAMADRIIYNLDPNGYLQGRLEDLLGPDAAKADVEFAPAGAGAGAAARSAGRWRPADLRECLLLQLRPGMPFYEQLHALISHHLEDLEHNRLPAISRRTGYSIEMIQTALEELRKLNPKPGAEFINTPIRGHARRVHRARRGGEVRGAARGGRTPACSSAPTTASWCSAARPTKRPASTSSARSIRRSG